MYTQRRPQQSFCSPKGVSCTHEKPGTGGGMSYVNTIWRSENDSATKIVHVSKLKPPAVPDISSPTFRPLNLVRPRQTPTIWVSAEVCPLAFLPSVPDDTSEFP